MNCSAKALLLAIATLAIFGCGGGGAGGGAGGGSSSSSAPAPQRLERPADSAAIAKRLFTRTPHRLADGILSERTATISDVQNWLGDPGTQSHKDFGGGLDTQTWTYLNDGRFRGNGDLRIDFVGDFVDNAFLGDECLLVTFKSSGH